jgi:MSHA biogenesis protein MshM
VNILAHKALMAAFGQGSRHIDTPHMRRAIQDTEDATPVSRWRLLWPTLGTAAMLTGIGMLSLWSSMA